MKRLLYLGALLTIVSLLPLRLHAQALPAATRSAQIQVGVGGTFAAPDYGQRYVKGISVYGDIDFPRHLGVEADVHLASIITPTDIGEDSYLIGPRYSYQRNRLRFYGKALFGVGQFQYQYDYRPHYHENYFVYAFGGGLDIHATKRINIRAIDFEAQRWPGYPQNGITPYVTTIGVAYAFR